MAISSAVYSVMWVSCLMNGFVVACVSRCWSPGLSEFSLAYLPSILSAHIGMAILFRWFHRARDELMVVLTLLPER